MRAWLLVLLVIVLLAFPAPVSADIAPPAQTPGSNPLPGSSSTQVRMVAESVLIDIQADTPADTLATALVSAEFNMRNLGTESESMAVRFPIGSSDGWGNIPEIENITVKVDGRSVQLRRISGEDPSGMVAEVPWVEFDAVFPPGEDVEIWVAYTLKAAGEMPYVWFNYIFSTGAGWQGSIGSAELIVRFPYEVNLLNHIQGSENSYKSFTPGGVISGKEIRWTWTEFEPNQNDNFTITLAAPSTWRSVLHEQSIVTKSPSDGEAWGRLGKLYKSLLMSPHGERGFRDYLLKDDPGAQELFRLSDEAYRKAVELKPEDALWHAGYADLLGFYAYYARWEGYETIPASISALDHMNTALKLAPEDATVQDIAYTLYFYFEDGGMTKDGMTYDFPWLTATPLATATELIPVSPTPTATERVVEPTSSPELAQPTPKLVQSTPTAKLPEPTTPPPDGEGLKVCGVGLLIPLLLVFLVKLFR